MCMFIYVCSCKCGMLCFLFMREEVRAECLNLNKQKKEQKDLWPLKMHVGQSYITHCTAFIVHVCASSELHIYILNWSCFEFMYVQDSMICCHCKRK